MWRLNIRRKFIGRMFEVQKFFLDRKHDFVPGEPLLIQVVKQDEPGRLLGRVRGIILFGRLAEDTQDESVRLYQVKWNYVILPRSTIRLTSDEWFNLEDIIGAEAASRYYGQAEAVKLKEEDAQAIGVRLSRHIT